MQFAEQYAKLNKAQKEAVDTIDGPVMVVAGPGTGKTQVLSLRIANILKETDTPASAILCLTFTNSGVRAMRERLSRLIGKRGSEVHVSTFHRFSIGLIEKYWELLDVETLPELLSETEAVSLVDEILEGREWDHIRPRGDSGRYFGDLKSLVSLMKREGVTPEEFLSEIEIEIETLKTDPENISSRGARKGELKREVEKKIESLLRTKEVVLFYEAYEKAKKERSLMDYDDILSFAVRLVQESEEVRADIRENFLYVHVDEHQDSSGVQNAFLRAVWADVEHPNIFVVGDDRQLIYGFGGASLEQFTGFLQTFSEVKQITLIENYRSSQSILDAADFLLESSLAKGKLQSVRDSQGEKIRIFECDYPRDEMLYIARDIKKKIEEGILPEHISVLVPKNHQARVASEILRDVGIPVSSSGVQSFFSLSETKTLMRILSVISDPYDAVSLSELFIDPVMGIPPLEAHHFLRASGRKLSLEFFLSQKVSGPIEHMRTLFQDWIGASVSLGPYALIQKIGEDLFFEAPKDHELLVRRVEVVRTFIHLLSAETTHENLKDFVQYLSRLKHYGHEIPLATFSGSKGVHVLTHFGSKGLEFDAVYIAHLDEGSLMKGKRMGFSLPERFSVLIEAKSEISARRELYVAMTRARKYCALSYSRKSYSGGELLPARILSDIPEERIERKTVSETEGEILSDDPREFVRIRENTHRTTKEELAEILKEEYADTNVSVTLLNNFFECPWTWYFRNMLKMPEAKSESLLLGSVVHTGIEYLLKGGDKESLQNVVSDALEKEHVFDEGLFKRLLKKALSILKNFKVPDSLSNVTSERSVTYRDPKRAHLACYGKIDMTEEIEDGVRVTDFKTGSAKTDSEIQKMTKEGRMSSLLRQLAMYSYLLENAEKKKVKESVLLFLEENEQYSTTITNEEVELLKKDIADYDDALREGTWIARTCTAPSYGSKRGCEYCDKAKLLYD